MFKNCPLSVRRSADPGVPLHEALQGASDKSYAIASYNEVSSVLTRTDKDRLSAALECWSGTLVAYTSPGKALGEAAVVIGDQHYLAHEGLYFPVPKQALDAKDVVLVRNSPFRVSGEADGLILIIKVYDVDILPFPSKYGGNFILDEKYGLPIGMETDAGDHRAGYLVRQDQYVGLVASDGGTIAKMTASHDDCYGLITSP